MKLCVITIFDVKAQAFHVPMFVPAVGVGVRTVSDEINRADKAGVLAAHPEDFRIFELGSFDDNVGQFVLHPMPVLVTDCSSLKVSSV